MSFESEESTMAENTNPTTPAATAVDPLQAALQETGGTTTTDDRAKTSRRAA